MWREEESNVKHMFLCIYLYVYVYMFKIANCGSKFHFICEKADDTASGLENHNEKN